MTRQQATLGIFCFSLLLIAGCASEQKPEKPAVDQPVTAVESWSTQVIYQVLFPFEASDPVYRTNGISVNASAGSFDQFLGEQYDAAVAGNMTVFPADFLGEPETEAISVETLQKMLTKTDTVYTEDMETGAMVQTVVDASFTKNVLTGLLVKQQWAYSTAKNSFRIQSSQAGVSAPVFNETTGNYRGISPMFYFPLNPAEASDEAYELNWPMESHVTIDTNRWLQVRSLVDVSETPRTLLKNIALERFRDCLAGTRTAHEGPNVRAKLDLDQVESLMLKVDTLYETKNGKTVPFKVMETPIEERDIVGVAFNQKWSYAPSSNQLAVQITSMAPIIPVRDPDSGIITAYRPLFWIDCE